MTPVFSLRVGDLAAYVFRHPTGRYTAAGDWSPKIIRLEARTTDDARQELRQYMESLSAKASRG